MAVQPKDRQRMKHNASTAKRQLPNLVVRNHKAIYHEIAPFHIANGPNSWRRAWRSEAWW